MSTATIIPASVRVYYTCENKHKIARDYTIELSTNGKLTINSIYRMNGSERIRQYDDAHKLCAHEGCEGHYTKVSMLEKTSTNTNRKCTASCKNAMSKECDCTCGGSNHGINHLMK
jgi:hypothetical protein